MVFLENGWPKKGEKTKMNTLNKRNKGYTYPSQIERKREKNEESEIY